MIMMMVPLVALLLGVLCGGRPDALVRLPLRRLWLVPLAFAIQWVVIRIPTMEPHPALGLALVGSYGAILRLLAAQPAVAGGGAGRRRHRAQPDGDGRQRRLYADDPGDPGRRRPGAHAHGARPAGAGEQRYSAPPGAGCSAGWATR